MPSTATSVKFRGCSVGQTLRRFLFSCFTRGSAIRASFAIRSWSANGQLGTLYLQDDRLIRLSYVPPSAVKDFLSVPTSPVSIFVLKLSDTAPVLCQEDSSATPFPLFFFFSSMKCCGLQHCASAA